MPKAPPTPKSNPLTNKVGPLPLWGWLAVGAAAIYFYMRQGSSTGTAQATSQQGQAGTLPYPTYQDYGQYGAQPNVFAITLPSAASAEQGTSTATSTGTNGATTPAPFEAGYGSYNFTNTNNLGAGQAAGIFPGGSIPIYGSPGSATGKPNVVGSLPYGAGITPTGPEIGATWPGGEAVHFYPVQGGYVGVGDIGSNPAAAKN